MGKNKINKIPLWQVIFSIIGILIILAVLSNGFRGSPENKIPVNTDKTEDITKEESLKIILDNIPREEIDPGNNIIKGSSEAKVTIIEFSDFECPVCRTYFSKTYKDINKYYIETGLVKYIFMDFPLSFHKNAEISARAAECAGEQGKYWEMHDALFESTKLDKESLKKHAQNLNLDLEEFNYCLESGRHIMDINSDFNKGVNAGVKGTPTFFVNGIKMEGYSDFNEFKELIDAELKR